MARDFRQLLAGRIVVFDGATGTRLYDAGVFLNRCFDELNLTNPELVEEVHRAYVEVGVDVIETNTFGASRPKLAKHGLDDDVEAINEAGARIARAAAGDDCLVAGAIGPLGLRIEPWGPTSVAEAAGLFAEQARALVAGGADLICLETFYDLAEVEAAVQGVRQVCDLPIVAQMTINDDGNSLEGVAPDVFGPRLAALDVDAVGVNCSVGPAAMLAALERMVPVVSKPLAVQPNAGRPRVVENRNFYLCSPEYMAVHAKRMITAGAKIVGGCCGTTPEHLKAILRAVRAMEPQQRSMSTASSAGTIEESKAVEPVPFEERSRFSGGLAESRFVVSVEMLPPKGHDLSRCLAGARKLHDAGVDVINIPDGPRASARMSPMALAVALQAQVGIETLIHYCCRDRNLLGMQSDLLGAHCLGLRNVLVITGDPPKLGDYPDATAVFDVDSIGLTNMVRRLNCGLDVGGNPIGEPTSLCVGVGANPGALDIKREVSRFEWKVDAGAEFAITQPVFDVDAFLSFLERIEHVRIPVLAGIWPLASYRNAEFMNNEVPGVDVPQSVLDRMRRAETKEAARRTGIEIAQEMLETLLPHIQGVQIAAPFGRYQTAIDVMQAIPADRLGGE
ncbi:MAG: bifunctional homocysteine S-methyltransferase/methylenetetrahydrofolate reductase [bacterium]|nr:bifunctional homocysteine S-methyltransferase/methylenetetrahydrofolate reductase [bacterium]